MTADEKRDELISFCQWAIGEAGKPDCDSFALSNLVLRKLIEMRERWGKAESR